MNCCSDFLSAVTSTHVVLHGKITQFQHFSGLSTFLWDCQHVSGLSPHVYLNVDNFAGLTPWQTHVVKCCCNVTDPLHYPEFNPCFQTQENGTKWQCPSAQQFALTIRLPGYTLNLSTQKCVQGEFVLPGMPTEVNTGIPTKEHCLY